MCLIGINLKKSNFLPNISIYYEQWLHVSTLQGHHQVFIMNHYIHKAQYILGIPINVYKYEIGSCPYTEQWYMSYRFADSL